MIEENVTSSVLALLTSGIIVVSNSGIIVLLLRHY